MHNYILRAYIIYVHKSHDVTYSVKYDWVTYETHVNALLFNPKLVCYYITKLLYCCQSTRFFKETDILLAIKTCGVCYQF